MPRPIDSVARVALTRQEAAASIGVTVDHFERMPATPANLGVFHAACAAVLHAGWHVGIPTGVAYGVILQAVEVATAILMGAPALLKEGMSWREVRMRAMHATPVKLPARPQRSPRPARPQRRSGAEAHRIAANTIRGEIFFQHPGVRHIRRGTASL